MSSHFFPNIVLYGPWMTI